MILIIFGPGDILKFYSKKDIWDDYSTALGPRYRILGAGVLRVQDIGYPVHRVQDIGYRIPRVQDIGYRIPRVQDIG